MTEITFVSILDKIRSICKECNMIEMPERIAKQQNGEQYDVYLKTLESIRGELIRYRQLEQEYWKLQNVLQKLQTDLRKKIGFEQQIRLYNDALKVQIQQLELQKLQLLSNSKQIIRQLKRTNEEMFIELNTKISNSIERRQKKQCENNNEQRGIKTDRTQTVDKAGGSVNIEFKKKNGGEDEFHEIVKTEQIERNKTGRIQNSSRKHKMRLHSSDQNIQTDFLNQIKVKQISNTFQISEEKTDREITTNSKKKYQKNMYSNLFVPKYTKRQQQKDLKNIYLAKSPDFKQRQGKDKQSKRLKPKLKMVNRSLWKDRVLNKSVMSAGSMQPALSNKQTL